MPTLPSADGLTFRLYTGPADHPSMVDLINRVNRADGIDELASVADMDASYGHMTDCDPTTDCLLAFDADTLVSYGRVGKEDEVNGPRKYFVFAHVDPSHRSTGLHRRMLDWLMERARERAATSPREDTLFESFAEETNESAVATLVELGFAPITYAAAMVRPHLDDIPDAPLPDGLEVREATPENERLIWEADVEAFRDHWGFVEQTEEDWLRHLARPQRDLTLWRVAWDGDEVAGQVRTFVDPEENEAFGRLRGYTEDISTRRKWRRRGVAKALIAESLRELKRRGFTEAALGVHTENPNGAFELYESLGYSVVRMTVVFQRPFSVSDA